MTGSKPERQAFQHGRLMAVETQEHLEVVEALLVRVHALNSLLLPVLGPLVQMHNSWFLAFAAMDMIWGTLKDLWLLRLGISSLQSDLLRLLVWLRNCD